MGLLTFRVHLVQTWFTFPESGVGKRPFVTWRGARGQVFDSMVAKGVACDVRPVVERTMRCAIPGSAHSFSSTKRRVLKFPRVVWRGQVFDSMVAKGVACDAIVYNVAISAVASTGDTARAQVLIIKLEAGGWGRAFRCLEQRMLKGL